MLNGIGDSARHFILSRQHSSLNTQLGQLTQELASGRRSSVADPITGGYQMLGDLSRSETLLQGYAQSVSEARLITTARQSTLEHVQSISQSLSSDLLVSNGVTRESLEVVSNHAKETLRDMVSSLNGVVAGRSLFAGTDTSGPALSSADDMFTALRVEVSGSTTPESITQAVEDWFNGPGFATAGYLGNDEPDTFQLSDSDRVQSAVSAKSDALVTLMTETAIAALATEIPGLDTQGSQALLRSSGEALLNAQGNLTTLRADLGVVQERVDVAEARNAAKLSSIQIARSEIVSSDPYATATALENTRLQLEALYTVTARLSGLSLTSFLR